MQASRSETTFSQASSSSAYSGRRHRSGGSEADLHSQHSASSRHRSSRHSLSRHSNGSHGGHHSKGMTLNDMQRHVQEEAMQRYVQTLEEDAKAARRETETWGSTVRCALDQEKNETRRRRDAEKKNQQGLLRQIEGNKASKVEARKEYIQAASSHSFPLFTETFISEDEVNAVRKQQKEQWREELNQQLITSKMLRNLEEKKHHDMAIRTNQESVRNTIRERHHERDRLVRQGRELVEAWDRDVRLKSIKEAIRCGKDMDSPVVHQPGRTPPSHMGMA